MYSFFHLLCESTPLATLSMLFALLLLKLRRSPAARIHLVLMATCTISILSPILSTTLPKWRVLPAVTASDSPIVSSKLVLNDAGGNTFISSKLDNFLWFRVAGGIWITGVGILVSVAVVRYICLRRFLGHAVSLPSSTILLAETLKTQRGIRRDIKWLTRHGVKSAFTVGVFRPVIVLPENHQEMSLEDLRIVLDHELAHVKRLDALSGLVLQIFVTMWWFHPLTWLVFRSVDIMKERACDDLVLLSGKNPRRYAACLGEAVLRAHDYPVFLNGVSSFARRAPQLLRLHAILDPSINRCELTLRETWNVCAPAILAALVLSSLGFKAASELQANRPVILEGRPGEVIPSLWSDAVLPIAQRVGVPVSVDSPASEVATVEMDTESIITSRPAQVLTLSSNNDSTHEWKVRAASSFSRRTSTEVSSTPRNFDEENTVLTRGENKNADRARGAAFAFNSDVRGALVAGSGVQRTPSSFVSSEGIDGLAEFSSGSAYGYVVLEDDGVMVYSEIVEDSGAKSSLDFNVPESKLVGVSNHSDFWSSSQSINIGQAYSVGGVDIAPEDLGIRNLETSVSQSEKGAQLSVSVEVPEVSAGFWKVEASVDTLEWTDAEDVVTHKFCPSNSPGFLRLSASIVEAGSSAKYAFLRLKGKW